MAGGHNPNPLLVDPALVKYNNMHMERYKYFRWTPRTSWLTFVYVVAVPVFIGYWGYTTEGKWDMRGKKRGDTISEF